MTKNQQYTALQCNPAANALSLSLASTADWPALAQLWRRAMLAAESYQPREDITIIEPLLASHYFAPLNVLQARNPAGELVGFISCQNGHIDMLFVDPAQQRWRRSQYLAAGSN